MEIQRCLDTYVNDYQMHVFEVAWLTEEQISHFHSDFKVVANNKLQYTLVAEGINKCLKKFIESPEWRNINWKLNFWMDNITGEKTKIWDADGLKEKARYVKYCIKK